MTIPAIRLFQVMDKTGNRKAHALTTYISAHGIAITTGSSRLAAMAEMPEKSTQAARKHKNARMASSRQGRFTDLRLLPSADAAILTGRRRPLQADWPHASQGAADGCGHPTVFHNDVWKTLRIYGAKMKTRGRAMPMNECNKIVNQ